MTVSVAAVGDYVNNLHVLVGPGQTYRYILYMYIVQKHGFLNFLSVM